MAGQTNPLLIAVYPDPGRAEAAIDKLWHAGFKKEQIGVASPGGRLHQATTATEGLEEKAADGAVAGAVTGTALGALAGAAAVAVVPPFGPILAGGLLAGIVGGAAAGAALGTFAGPFVAMGLTEDEARHYEKDFRAGRTIVVVQAGDREEEALTILRSFDPLKAQKAGRLTPIPR